MTLKRSTTRALLAWAALGAAAQLPGWAGAETPAVPTQKAFSGPHRLGIAVEMIGPVTQTTDLQILCILKHEPSGDKYIEAMDDFNNKLGHLLSGLRDRGEFAGDLGETFLFNPPAGSIAPKRVLLIGVGSESDLTLEKLRVAGRIAVREAVRLGAVHVSFAPTLRDQGSTRLDVGDGDRAVVEEVILAYDTEKRAQTQGLTPVFDIADWTIEAGPTYYPSVAEKVGLGVKAAAETVQRRSASPYRDVQ